MWLFGKKLIGGFRDKRKILHTMLSLCRPCAKRLSNYKSKLIQLNFSVMTRVWMWISLKNGTNCFSKRRPSSHETHVWDLVIYLSNGHSFKKYLGILFSPKVCRFVKQKKLAENEVIKPILIFLLSRHVSIIYFPI